jgi:excisionase family DNA binding protein
MADNLVDTGELSSILNISQASIRTWARSGRIPSYQSRPGGKFLFNVHEVEQALRRPAPPALAGAR